MLCPDYYPLSEGLALSPGVYVLMKLMMLMRMTEISSHELTHQSLKLLAAYLPSSPV